MANQANPDRAEKRYAPMYLGTDPLYAITTLSIAIQPATAIPVEAFVDGRAEHRLGHITIDDCDRPILAPCEHATSRMLERLIAITTDIIEFEQPVAGAAFDIWARDEVTL
ncbi:hypothetical protein [Nocardia tengchongensis]|uniref:hypothetical protein n=1 Tax=Nocardia tengchongensis TaxID=2055889 RepID=UPI0036CA1B21